MAYRITESMKNAPNRMHEWLDSGVAPLTTIKAGFVAGEDSILAKCDGDPDTQFTSETQRERYAAKTGAVKMSGDEYMQWQKNLKTGRKQKRKDDLKKARHTAIKQALEIDRLANKVEVKTGGCDD